MKIESRYVEYSFGNKVHEGKWIRYMKDVPEGCLDVGVDELEAQRRVKRLEKMERRHGGSNFEYRVIR